MPGSNLLCFSRVLGESGGYIRENSAVLVTGRISVRDEKEPQIMVDTIAPLNQGEVQQQEKEPRLYIRMPSRQDPRMRKVELVLSFFPGEGQAVLYFEDTKKRYGARLVGDRVLFTPLEHGSGSLDGILPRKNEFQRPAVANVDQLVIIVSQAFFVPSHG